MAKNPKFAHIRTVALQLEDETSHLIAQLRHSYDIEGREMTSLRQVVADAVLAYHNQFYAVRPQPSDSDAYLRTVLN